MAEQAMTYEGSGIKYDVLDDFKRLAQAEARKTDGNISDTGYKVVEWSRGESVFLIENEREYLGLVIEGLGTKNRVEEILCDVLKKLYDRDESLIDHICICNGAMTYNDMSVLGVRPLVYGKYLALGAADWLRDASRRQKIAEGTRRAADMARCVYGPGETAALPDLIEPNTADFAGAAMGIVAPKERLVRPETLCDGDAIVLIGSSGIHSNALTLARKIADKLPDGYLTGLPDGRTYGETLLDPTIIYVDLVQKCLDAGVEIHYMVNITGHGWRKLMRAREPFTYVIDRIPEPQPIFRFMQEHGPVEDREAYQTWNMGAGWAIYTPLHWVNTVAAIADDLGLPSIFAGHVENGPKQVIIVPKGITYTADELKVR